MYRVTKTYGHNLGLSTTFRQWRATSHCRFLHGYALEVKLVFAAPKLNSNNWVIDFGSLKPVKAWLSDTFDHKTLVAEDDPMLSTFVELSQDKITRKPYQRDHDILSPLMAIVKVPATGCEAFAKYIADNVQRIVFEASDLQGGADNGVYLESVEVREHGANSAIYYPDYCEHLNRGCEPETGTRDRDVTRKDIEDARTRPQEQAGPDESIPGGSCVGTRIPQLRFYTADDGSKCVATFY